ncbi:MAG: hypothetical protein AAF927_17295 [Bacteroidota bacterium]
MELTFLIELIIVGLIIVIQFWVFFRNLGAIKKLGDLFPQLSQLEVNAETVVDLEAADTSTVPQLADKRSFSTEFRDIVQMTNAYLTRNKGASQGERLQEIAERKSESMESAIETNLPLPLYIGLLATFTGVIIGLIEIARYGVTDDAIQSFIGGVIVGMVGSAIGLALTVRSNYALKLKVEARDEGMENYFQFLRTKVFHPEAAPVQGSVKGLRDSLSAFQAGFAQYQTQMNDSLGETLRMFRELNDAFKQVRSIGQELNGLNTILRNNGDVMEKQAQYFATYQQKADAFTRKLSENLQTVDAKLETTVSENIKALDNGTQAAFLKMDQYLANLDGTEKQSFANSLVSNMDQEVKSRKMLTETVVQLQTKLQEMETQKSGVLGNGIVQVFMYTGIAAFILGISSGALYIINTIAG